MKLQINFNGMTYEDLSNDQWPWKIAKKMDFFFLKYSHCVCILGVRMDKIIKVSIYVERFYTGFYNLFRKI